MARYHLPVLTLVLLSMVLLGGRAYGQPCTNATDTCAEWVALPDDASRVKVYRTYPLDERKEEITRALVMVHGGGRNADDIFLTSVAGAVLTDGLADTLIIAPRFASNHESCSDALSSGEINWNCGAGRSGGWRTGSPAVSHASVTSFDLADVVLRRLADAEVFPNLSTITVAGFSAGGQYVNRYAMTNEIHEDLRVPVTYVVGSPSSYGYPDAYRPVASRDDFELYADARNCTAYDHWPYGLSERVGYASRLTMAQMRTQLAVRPVTYLLGELETPEAPALDVSCPAMAQGRSRLARGLAYFEYVTGKFGAMHALDVVPQCGHSSRCVFTANVALRVLYPEP